MNKSNSSLRRAGFTVLATIALLLAYWLGETAYYSGFRDGVAKTSAEYEHAWRTTFDAMCDDNMPSLICDLDDRCKTIHAVCTAGYDQSGHPPSYAAVVYAKQVPRLPVQPSGVIDLPAPDLTKPPTQ